MQSFAFIFSDKYRLWRHVCFWLSWWLFCSVVYAFSPAPDEFSLRLRFELSSVNAFFYLAPHMFLSYSLMYFVIPRLLLQGKYLLTIITVILLFVTTAAIASSIGVFVLEGIVLKYYLPYVYRRGHFHLANANFFLALMAGLRGAITVGGMAASIKLMKHWYIKEQRNMQLQKENAESQLQLLKAQVHPHFLFNTLNNIYSYTQDTSPVASKLVMGLSDMLRCMLYECNQSSIPLYKEIKLLKDYITLEKIRYDNRLDVSVDVPEDTDGLYIAPLLLLPFVENTFKHGTSQMLEQPWLSLNISVKDDKMHMRLLNGKACDYSAPSTLSGIGIQNVQRRLELLYAGKHTLKITNQEEVFIVDLRLDLERRTSARKNIIATEKAVTYE